MSVAEPENRIETFGSKPIRSGASAIGLNMAHVLHACHKGQTGRRSLVRHDRPLGLRCTREKPDPHHSLRQHEAWQSMPSPKLDTDFLVLGGLHHRGAEDLFRSSVAECCGAGDPRYSTLLARPLHQPS